MSVARVVSVPSEGLVALVRCGCGQCDKTFEPVRRRGQQRMYAEDCPVRAELQREKNRRSAEASYERAPRKCRCGCGRLLPPRLWYHPDCAKAAKATRDRPSIVFRPPAPGRRCGECQDQSWRRDERYGCETCGGKYAPERIRPRELTMGCALGHRSSFDD